MNRTIGSVLILLAAIGFGTIGIFGKLGFDAGLNNPTLLTFRFAIATVLLSLLLLRPGRSLQMTRNEFPVAIGLGVSYAILAGGFFWGLLYIPAGLAAITLYTYPIYVFAISVVLLGEVINRRKFAALLLAILGVVAIVGFDTAGYDPRGLFLVSLAAIAYAIYTTGSRVAVNDISAEWLALFAVATTTLVFLGFGLVTNALFVPTTLEQWAVIIGLAVFGTAAPIVLFVYGLEFVEASRASVLTTAEPPVTVILGVLILHEVLTIGIVSGGVLILIGIVLIQLDQRTTRPAVAPRDGDS